MSFSLASVKIGPETLPAIGCDGRMWPLPAAAASLGLAPPPPSLTQVFADWDVWQPIIYQIGAAVIAGEVAPDIALGENHELALPLAYPRKVFCTGANYADHLAEMGASLSKVEGRHPFFSLKPPTTCLVGPGPTVAIPQGCGNFDWEVEVVIVFGRSGRTISQERAMDHVAGYTLGIDFTARDQFLAPHLPFKFDFVLGKCQDRTTPIGPVIVPKDFVDLQDLHFSLSVNGVRKQDGNTANMVYSLAEQIAGISRAVTIEAGDILFTGSPAGVGAARGESLQVGDCVEVESPLTGAMQVVIQPPGISV